MNTKFVPFSQLYSRGFICKKLVSDLLITTITTVPPAVS